MAGVTIKIEGLEATMAKLDYKKYEVQIQQSFDKFGFNAETEAKLRAPVDEGHLRSAIYSKSKPLAAEIGCTVDYAAYLEFGTRRFAAAYVAGLPATWQELAANFKGGGGGNFEQFVKELTEWVMRKGFAAPLTASGNASKSKSAIDIQRQAAYMIARSIMIKGIRPHPFLYPAVEKWTPVLLSDLKALQVK